MYPFHHPRIWVQYIMFKNIYMSWWHHRIQRIKHFIHHNFLPQSQLTLSSLWWHALATRSSVIQPTYYRKKNHIRVRFSLSQSFSDRFGEIGSCPAAHLIDHKCLGITARGCSPWQLNHTYGPLTVNMMGFCGAFWSFTSKTAAAGWLFWIGSNSVRSAQRSECSHFTDLSLAPCFDVYAFTALFVDQND